MMPTVEHVPAGRDASFQCHAYATDAFPFAWHVHPEVELTLITAGRGRRYVGDSVEAFGPGDLVLLGPDLPHTWHTEPGPTAWPRACAAVVVQFRADFLGPGFLDRPEMRAVRGMLARSVRGLRFDGPTARRAADAVAALPRTTGGLTRLVALLGVLDRLARSRQVVELSGRTFDAPLGPRARRRVDAVFRLVQAHHDRPLTQADAARAVHLGPSAFARFFKRSTGRTFVDYVHEARVARACRLLVETELPVAGICFDAGFGNLANFNRVFKRLKGVSPRAFRQAFTSAGDAGPA